MSRCGGMGICGCGREHCAEAAWFAAWLRLWRVVGHGKAMRAFDLTDVHVEFTEEEPTWPREIDLAI